MNEPRPSRGKTLIFLLKHLGNGLDVETRRRNLFVGMRAPCANRHHRELPRPSTRPRRKRNPFSTANKRLAGNGIRREAMQPVRLRLKQRDTQSLENGGEAKRIHRAVKTIRIQTVMQPDNLLSNAKRSSLVLKIALQIPFSNDHQAGLRTNSLQFRENAEEKRLIFLKRKPADTPDHEGILSETQFRTRLPPLRIVKRESTDINSVRNEGPPPPPADQIRTKKPRRVSTRSGQHPALSPG